VAQCSGHRPSGARPRSRVHGTAGKPGLWIGEVPAEVDVLDRQETSGTKVPVERVDSVGGIAQVREEESRIHDVELRCAGNFPDI
jgi:hypothetical protein